MVWWLLPAAAWVVGAAVIARCAVVTLAEARLLLRTLDDLGGHGGHGQWAEAAHGVDRLCWILAATRLETARPASLLRSAARVGRRPVPLAEP